MVEIVCGITLLGLVLIPLMSIFTDVVRQVEIAKETTIATNDLKDVMEKIRTTALSHITTDYPDGAYIDENLLGAYLLDNEKIKVDYPNGVDANPLEILVTVTWKSIIGDTRTQRLSTLRSELL